MKKKLSLLVLLSTPIFTAQADNAINEQALQACSFIENDFNRLLCYDNTIAGKSLVKPTVTKKLTPPTANNVPVAANTAPAVMQAETTKGDFGLEHKQEVQVDKEAEIKAKVKSIAEAPYGELIITLENDQQWRQIGSDHMLLKENDTIIISRGTFNSFLLKKEGKNSSIRVKRTK